MNMDLRGNPKQDYDVRVNGGVGEAVVRLPSDVSVEAEAEGGIGEIKVQGMRKDGNRWYTEAYESGKPRIHLSVHGGIGSIRLVAD
jgi:hypothetical protein